MSKIYLNDESIREFKSIIKNEIGAMNVDSKAFFSELSAIYTKTGSDNLHKTFLTIKKFYSSDFKSKVNGILKKWEDNNASIVAVLKKEKEDSSSHISLAKKVQKDLMETVKELFKIDFEVPKDVETFGADQEQVWEQVKEVVIKYDKSLENKKSTFVANSNRKANDNQLILCVKALIEPVYESYLSLTDEICKGFNKKKEDVLGASKKASEAVKQENAGLNKQGKSAAEMFKDEFKMLLGDRYKSKNG